jgi:hypothetical protein
MNAMITLLFREIPNTPVWFIGRKPVRKVVRVQSKLMWDVSGLAAELGV